MTNQQLYAVMCGLYATVVFFGLLVLYEVRAVSAEVKALAATCVRAGEVQR